MKIIFVKEMKIFIYNDKYYFIMANNFITIIIDFDPYMKKIYKKANDIKKIFQNLSTIRSKNGNYHIYLFNHYARISKPVTIDLKEPGLRNPRSDKMRGLIIILEYLGMRDDIPYEKKRVYKICSMIRDDFEMTEFQVIWGKEDIN